MGKPVLSMPMRRQKEQFANALALDELELTSVMYKLDAAAIGKWLQDPVRIKAEYPNVAKAVSHWTSRKKIDQESANDMAKQLWADVSYTHY